MVEPRNVSPQDRINQQLILEMQRLVSVMENQSSSDGNKSTVIRPQSFRSREIASTDFEELLSEMRQENAYAKQQLAILQDIQKSNKEQTQLEKQQQIQADLAQQKASQLGEKFAVKKLGQKESVQEATKSLKRSQSDRSFMERVFESRRGGGGIFGSILGAFGSSLKDSMTDAIKENPIGKMLQGLDVIEGRETEKLESGLRQRLNLKSRMIEEQHKLEMMSLKEEMNNIIKEKKERGEIQTLEEEELERTKLLKEKRDEQIKEWNSLFSLSDRVDVGVQENEYLDKLMEMNQQRLSQRKEGVQPQKDSQQEPYFSWGKVEDRMPNFSTKPTSTQDTYTEDEEEKTDKRSGTLLSKILSEQEEQNQLLFSLSDPRGKMLNVRWPDDMGTGQTASKGGKEGGGLLSGLMGGLQKGIGGLAKGLGKVFVKGSGLISKGIAGVGAKLFGSVGAAGIGTTVAAVLGSAAAGAAIGTAIHRYGPEWLPFTEASWDKFREDQHQEAAKKAEKIRNQVTSKREKLEKETGMGKGDFAKLRGLSGMADTEEGGKEFRSELQKLSLKQQQSFLDVEASRASIRKQELEKAKEDAGWWVSDAEQEAFDEAQKELDRQNERVQNIMKNMGESEVSIEKTTTNNIDKSTKVSEDSTTKAVRDLQQTMEKIMTKSMSRLESNESNQFATKLSMETLQSPMTLPDSVLSQPPQAEEQMGTIPS